MASTINELTQIMTKQRALDLLIEWVAINGVPVKDVVVLNEEQQGQIVTWTYKGLKAFIMVT